eukprot:3366404-Heterocapsa_arctica.AAC.1
MPVMIAFVQRTSYGFAHIVPVKGMVTENVQTAFVSWLEEAGVGALRLRTDAEPAVKALAAQLAAKS